MRQGSHRQDYVKLKDFTKTPQTSKVVFKDLLHIKILLLKC